MKFVKASRLKVPFREIVCGDVFYSEDFGNYGMRIVARDATSYSNAILLHDGHLVYFPDDMEVELVDGEFVER
mgnify:FL=1|jgi:hypothetical protein